jgi:hypothetical protein
MNSELEKEPFPHLNPPFSTKEVLRIIKEEHPFIHWVTQNFDQPKGVAYKTALSQAMSEDLLGVMLAMSASGLKAAEKKNKKRS